MHSSATAQQVGPCASYKDHIGGDKTELAVGAIHYVDENLNETHRPKKSGRKVLQLHVPVER